MNPFVYGHLARTAGSTHSVLLVRGSGREGGKAGLLNGSVVVAGTAGLASSHCTTKQSSWHLPEQGAGGNRCVVVWGGSLVWCFCSEKAYVVFRRNAGLGE